MLIDNQNAWPMCQTDEEKVACLAEAMRRAGDDCTENNLKVGLGITKQELDKYADRARAKAAADSVRHTRVRVAAAPATQAA